MSVVMQTNWRSLAQSLQPRNQAFIGGKFVDALSGRTFPTYNPATGQLITQIAACDAADVDKAVQVARRAFDSGIWRDLKPTERKAILLRWSQLIREHLEELALLETLDTGKPIKESVSVDVPSCASAIQWYAECIDKLYDEVAPNGPSSLVLVTREPIGVVAAVVPWNYPLIISSWKIGPALAAGNSLILKPAEQSTLSALKLAELAQQAGIPDGVFNVVPGLGPEAGQAIGLHPDIDAVLFTGSTEVGRKFLEYSARSNLKRVGLELGGKSPHIVTKDADLEKAAMYVAYAIWYNMGQTCNAGSRLIVHRSIKDQLFELMRPWARRLYPGDPLEPTTELGALISAEHCDRVKYYIELGQQEGARVAFGGRQILQETGGWFLEPTVLENVHNDMRVAREEIFGPVLVAIEYDELEEAVAIANDSEYGLAAAVWCRDITQAHLVARQLRAGTVWINAFDHTSINAPFGGYKQSGHGRDKSLHAFDKVTELKTTWVELH
ncbi:aldehyde dehydrogenase [Meiothermus sp. Pnk-1]|uniref:aldehyde dehydrogenase n=1 Tax=Meiothermus sp. Pnk-1 TaxID=873128 RepID=UPI000D7C596A|nr:aldehyde dehydrogenase [Meiothermus sp. Pnk-1]PZA07487.1 aldehyde dehydrogenase PuuC [Meiothermus sp. Pnk-1]